MASFGENLRRERELRGVTLREIADTTKISMRFLQALEQDRLDVLPGGAFRRAFVREYARHLGLDTQRVLGDFSAAHGEESGEPCAPRVVAPSRGTVVAAAFALLLVPLLVAKAWRQRKPAAAVNAANSPSPAQASVARVYATPAATEPEDSEAVEHDGLALTLSAQEACWVAVQADGHTVVNRVLNQGESETVQARGEIVLSVGNAGGITFSVDDRRGVPLGRSGEVRRNIVITRDSLPSLVEGAGPAALTHGRS
jgi:cytoskeletal protein RodZ